VAWRILGAFLGRDVRLQSVDLAHEFEADRELSSSVLLIVLSDGLSASEEMEALLAGALQTRPLAMVFFGPGARVAFDQVLRLQSNQRIDRHTMTKVSSATDLLEAIEDFLHATWPAEELFDDWRTYSVVTVGDGKFCEKARAAIGAAID
jgi:hypothetical protein